MCVPTAFSLDPPGRVSCFSGVGMKRAHAADSRPAYLARQRAIIRKLIEETGWTSASALPSEKSLGCITPLSSNIIPFSSPEQRTRIS
jgi:hypothetical protein